MKKKKTKEEKWSDKHLIIDIEGFSKKQNQELKDKIMQRVAQRIERNRNGKSIS
jgi:uncharacterized metal-binding protein